MNRGPHSPKNAFADGPSNGSAARNRRKKTNTGTSLPPSLSSLDDGIFYLSAPTTTTAAASAPTTSPATVEVVIEGSCFRIRNALGVDEQIEVFREILKRSRTIDNSQKTPCMNPTPKTLIFDGGTPTLRFPETRTNGGSSNSRDGIGDAVHHDEHSPSTASAASLSSVFERLILRKAMKLVSQQQQQLQQQQRDGFDGGGGSSSNNDNDNNRNYDRYSVGVIRYLVPDGKFPEHVDHCNDPNARVVLLSLGCEAIMSVRGPGDDSPARLLRMASGDVLVFDPSTEAAVRHGVASVAASTCPSELAAVFPGAADHRYGVQCRTSSDLR